MACFLAGLALRQRTFDYYALAPALITYHYLRSGTEAWGIPQPLSLLELTLVRRGYVGLPPFLWLPRAIDLKR